jgi:hypothetical protein
MSGIILTCLLAQSTWYVDASAIPPGDGSLSNPYASIGYAVAQVSTISGDTVLVAPGDYLDEIVDFQGKNLLLRGTGGPGVTNVSAQQTFSPNGNSILRCISGEDSSLEVEGFTFWGSQGTQTGAGVGGGSALIIDSSPTLRNLVFRANVSPSVSIGAAVYLQRSSTSIIGCQFIDCGGSVADYGGAVAAIDSNISIDGTAFHNCDADDSGGAIYSSNSTISLTNGTLRACDAALGSGGAIAIVGTGSVSFIRDCQFEGNGSNAGGAIMSSAFLSVEACVFNGNGAFDQGNGGAIAAYGQAIVSNSVFTSNGGGRGGAVYASDVLISDCYFEGNRAMTSGSVTATGGAVNAGVGDVMRSTFVENQIYDGGGSLGAGGAAVYGSAALSIDNCTIVENAGNIGDAIRSVGAVRNSIIRENTPLQMTSVAAVAYCNVQGGASGVGNFDADPSFHGLRDFHLMPDSPCVDAGDPQSPVDPDGTIADVGSFFYVPTYCGANCTGSLGSPSCVANMNSTGRAAQLHAIGNTAVQLDHLILLIRDTPVGSLGFILASRLPSNLLLGGGSQGVLCLGTPVLRFSNYVLNDRGTGIVSFRPRLGQFPQSTSVHAGDTWYFQYWYRDTNPMVTSNTSNALRINFL